MYSGSRRWACACVALLAAASSAEAFAYMAGLGQVALRGVGAGSVRRGTVRPAPRPRHRPALVLSMQVQGEEKVKDVEEVTKKYGLEAGLFTALTSKDKSGPSAKDLLKKYGSAYLITSISLAIVSFSICYLLVDNGVDVAELLSKVGIEADGKTETAGTLAIAYAAHKAASPIRFPPTVALTPLTAKYLFNKDVPDEDK